jgi:hypothetical protein
MSGMRNLGYRGVLLILGIAVVVLAVRDRYLTRDVEYLELRTVWMRGEIERINRAGRAVSPRWADAYDTDPFAKYIKP